MRCSNFSKINPTSIFRRSIPSCRSSKSLSRREESCSRSVWSVNRIAVEKLVADFVQFYSSNRVINPSTAWHKPTAHNTMKKKVNLRVLEMDFISICINFPLLLTFAFWFRRFFSWASPARARRVCDRSSLRTTLREIRDGWERQLVGFVDIFPDCCMISYLTDSDYDFRCGAFSCEISRQLSA